MCFQQYTTIACPGCGYFYPYSIDIPIHCPESLLGSNPGFGTCAGGVKPTTHCPDHKLGQPPNSPADPARFGRSQARIRNLFSQLRDLVDPGSHKREYALREYALTCLYNPSELLEGAFDALATAKSHDLGGGHTAEIQDAPCVRDCGEDYIVTLENLGDAILKHSCDRVNDPRPEPKLIKLTEAGRK
ncbi:hypothetical protein PG985_003272 [Apiospora marii]|uniref:uncharacterized protein n=1 Tax=Apiospora marii TaxID=335849 RepID=UPI003131C6EE